jgi:subtilisin family serine protease
VGVFDTSPYDLSPGVYETTVTEPITKPLMRLTVHHPFDLPAFAVSSTITTPVIVKDHGLFVSSLVYAADSLSEIHLYRVLDKMGCGTLYHLNLAMLNFISNDWNGKLKQPAVINLSLGIQRPRDLPPGKDPASYLPQLGISDGQIIAAYQLAAVDPTIESLRTVVGLAFRAGMVVVAAAGNDSVNEPPSLPGMPLGMQYPAWYSSVIGVSATDPEDNLSCYSNQGDVAAPGGAAEPGMSQTPGPTGQPVSICLPKADDCLTIDQPGQPSDCRYGLVGFSKESSTGYSYWVGTSFATPLVAGLAARSYENNPGNPGAVYQFITAQGPGVVRAP